PGAATWQAARSPPAGSAARSRSACNPPLEEGMLRRTAGESLAGGASEGGRGDDGHTLVELTPENQRRVLPGAGRQAVGRVPGATHERLQQEAEESSLGSVRLLGGKVLRVARKVVEGHGRVSSVDGRPGGQKG